MTLAFLLQNFLDQIVSRNVVSTFIIVGFLSDSTRHVVLAYLYQLIR